MARWVRVGAVYRLNLDTPLEVSIVETWGEEFRVKTYRGRRYVVFPKRQPARRAYHRLKAEVAARRNGESNDII